MKKIMLGMLVLATSNAMALGHNFNLYGKVGIDFVSKFESISPSVYAFSAPSKNKAAPNLFLELTYNITPQAEIGLGSGYIYRKSYDYKNNGKVSGDFSGPTQYVDIIEYSKLQRYSSIPLYLIGKYNFNIKPNLDLYLKGDLGYSFNKTHSNHNYINYADLVGTGQYRKERETTVYTSVTNGHYYGVGIGLEYKNFLTEISYHHSSATLKYHAKGLNQRNDSYNNDAVRFSIGYKF